MSSKKRKRKRKPSKGNKNEKNHAPIPISIVLDEPPNKKSRLDETNDDTKYVYIVMSREELYVYVHYDNRPHERYKEIHGVFTDLNEANQCAMQVFTKLELEIAKTKRSRKEQLNKQLEKYHVSKTNKPEPFNETADWIEKDMMQRTHVWIIKEELLDKYSSKRKRTYDWTTSNYIWK